MAYLPKQYAVSLIPFEHSFRPFDVSVTNQGIIATVRHSEYGIERWSIVTLDNGRWRTMESFNFESERFHVRNFGPYYICAEHMDCSGQTKFRAYRSSNTFFDPFSISLDRSETGLFIHEDMNWGLYCCYEPDRSQPVLSFYRAEKRKITKVTSLDVFGRLMFVKCSPEGDVVIVTTRGDYFISLEDLLKGTYSGLETSDLCPVPIICSVGINQGLLFGNSFDSQENLHVATVYDCIRDEQQHIEDTLEDYPYTHIMCAQRTYGDGWIAAGTAQQHPDDRTGSPFVVSNEDDLLLLSESTPNIPALEETVAWHISADGQVYATAKLGDRYQVAVFSPLS